MEEKQTKKIGKRRTQAQRLMPTKHLEQLKKKARVLSGQSGLEDVSLNCVFKNLSNLEQVHEQLKKSLVSYSEQLMAARLRQEIEDAQEECTAVEELAENEFDDGVIIDICKEFAFHRGRNMKDQSEPTRKRFLVENKIICGLKEGQIGVQYDAVYGGKQVESFYLILAGEAFSENLSVSDHTVPFFLPLKEVQEEHLSSSAATFISVIGDLLQAYVSRREQIRVFKESNVSTIKHFSTNVMCDAIDFMVEECDCKVTVKLGYNDLHSDLPTQTTILAWLPASSMRKFQPSLSGETKATTIPVSLIYAEKILQQELLPQAYKKVVSGLNTILSGDSTVDVDPVTPALGD